ncbi:hypothetical protein [Candidatus Magnetaquicoccus inordinatus]|uniref:hypothetical protein n=1 Tax=Candidatus Magnetaquicoccus inordinatus TaxID=2496818 RepID=UPI00102C852F|nr:hypothetical protein [Candidatus Magnetaquicoccus inordinatus]
MNDIEQEIQKLYSNRLIIPFNKFCRRCLVGPVKQPATPYLGKHFFEQENKVMFVSATHNSDVLEKLDIQYMLDSLDKSTSDFIDGSLKGQFEYPEITKICFSSLVICPQPLTAIRESIVRNCLSGLQVLWRTVKILEPDVLVFTIPKYLYNFLEDLSPIIVPDSEVIEITSQDAEISQGQYSAPFWLREITSSYGKKVRVVVVDHSISYEKFYQRILEMNQVDTHVPKMSNYTKTILAHILAGLEKK